MDRRKRSLSAHAFRIVWAVAVLVCLAPGGSAQQSAATQREEARREGWQRVPEILVAVGAQPGARIADVGAGDGFFTIRLARTVGRGVRVTAVDISAQALERLRRRLTEEGITNVDAVQGDAADPNLAAASLDGILIVNAYHEIERYEQALARLRDALKPGGRLVLVEPIDPNLRLQPRDRQTRSHSIAAPFAIGEVRAAGFEIIGLQDPFAHTGSTEEWMLVARRGEGPAPPKPAPNLREGVAAPRSTASAEIENVGSEAELASADLRIGQGELKALLAQDAVLLLDIGAQEAYEDGHLPGAILVPLSTVPDRLDMLRGEKRRIVTYCS